MSERTVKSQFPRTIDRPLLFLSWEVDEFALLILPMIISLIIREMLVGIVIGVLLMNAYIKIKRNKPENYFFHLLWNWGIVNVKGTPPAHSSTFVE
jgi:type IV conjugative transfer system protein TraL